MKCKHCNSNEFSRHRGLKGFEVLIVIVLFFISVPLFFYLNSDLVNPIIRFSVFLLPIVYYIYKESIPTCNKCLKRIK